MSPSLVLMTALLAPAHAQDIEMPDLNAQAFRPSIDSRATLWTDDAFLAPGGYYNLRLAANWAHQPLVVRWNDGSTTALVKDSVNLDLMAGITVWRIRAGLDLPLYLLSTSEIEGGGAGLGDIAVDVRGNILSEQEDAPLGLAVAARMGLPTATVDAALGSPGLSGELGLVASKQLTDQLLLAANLGTRFNPETQLVNVEIDDQLYYRLGGGYALTDDAGVSLDVAGHLNYNEPFGNPAANPLEGLLGGWYRFTDSLILRGGVGHGFTKGIASPDVRLVAMLGWEPRIETDTDGDGLVDSADACPEQPEDFDQWEDRDGCPDPSGVLTVRVVDADDKPVPGATVKVTGPQGFEGGAEVGGELHPGAYKVLASAEGYGKDARDVELVAGEDQDITIVLAPNPGLVQVLVKGPEGEPVEATFTVGDSDPVTTSKGRGELEMAPGNYGVTVRAEGYAVENRKLSLEAGETELIEVELRPTQVELTVEKIEIKGEVYFDTAKATIKPESFPLLDEVAQVMKDHPELLKLRIEGHTDSRGGDAYNLQLSKDRAASVLQYLVEHGVEAGRLESEGYGETKPLDKRENEAAWSKNRRVDFFIAERAEPEAAE
jgi:outer membrane protein OmpA-like peptidoglycan-associated protein